MVLLLCRGCGGLVCVGLWVGLVFELLLVGVGAVTVIACVCGLVAGVAPQGLIMSVVLGLMVVDCI